MIVLRIVGNKPAEAPDGWLIFNAPRPISGHKTWRGEFVHGDFYAAIDPRADDARSLVERAVSLGAWILEYLSREQAIEMAVRAIAENECCSIDEARSLPEDYIMFGFGAWCAEDEVALSDVLRPTPRPADGATPRR